MRAVMLCGLALFGVNALGCGSSPAEARGPVRQSEVRHCAAGSPPLTSLGLSVDVRSPSETDRVVRLTNTTSEPLRLQSVNIHMGFGRCGESISSCDTMRAAKAIDLAPGESMELAVDASLRSLRYPCTLAVLGVIVYLSDTVSACSDIGAWTAQVGDRAD